MFATNENKSEEKKKQIQPNQYFGPCSIAPIMQYMRQSHFHSQPENPSKEEKVVGCVCVCVFVCVSI